MSVPGRSQNCTVPTLGTVTFEAFFMKIDGMPKGKNLKFNLTRRKTIFVSFLFLRSPFSQKEIFKTCSFTRTIAMFGKLRDIDFYRKIPKDLTESTTHGTLLSFCAALFMLVLFIAELWAFLSSQIVTNVVIDPNTDSLLRINFNITVMVKLYYLLK